MIPATEVISDSDGAVLAIVVRDTRDPMGVHFVTPNDLQQQVAVMNRPAGDQIAAHSHLPVARSVQGTQEVLIIQEGLLEAEIFSHSRKLVAKIQLKAGDLIILVSGGHGFKVVEECKFIEVKQGPYSPGKDKVLFDGTIL